MKIIVPAGTPCFSAHFAFYFDETKAFAISVIALLFISMANLITFTAVIGIRIQVDARSIAVSITVLTHATSSNAFRGEST